MSRRRRSAAAFSLFSFQDIITSVTAILILLVLILSLELVTRRQEAAAATPAVSRTALVEVAATLKALVEKLAAAVPSDEPRAVVRRTQRELERDLHVIEDQARQTAAAAEAARGIENRARALAAAAVARLDQARLIRQDVDEMKEQAARVDKEAAKLAVDNEREADRLTRKQKELVETPSAGAELVFNAPEQSDTQAWIVEVSGDGLSVVKLGTNERRELGAGLGAGSAAAKWLAELSRGGDHALILVRPSGADDVEEIREVLSGAGISFGIDFIGEDQVVRDGLGEAKAGGDGDAER